MKKLDANSKVLIIGLGKTGFACLEFLDARCQVHVIDSRDEPPYYQQFMDGSFSASAQFGTLDLEIDKLKIFTRVIVSPGLPRVGKLFSAIEALAIPIMGDVDLLAENTQQPIIAITGSNGKSTVTDMLGTLINSHSGFTAAVGGNIGIPAVSLIDVKADFFVIELSSFQLETATLLKPAVAVVLNVSEDHMDRYPSFACYEATKLRIYERCSQTIINCDQSAGYNYQANNAFCFYIDRKNACKSSSSTYLAGETIVYNNQPLIAVSDLALKGKHNLLNALAVVSLAKAIGISNEAIVAALLEYRGLAHRCQLVMQKYGVTWINDSKATNVGATVAALQGLGDTKNIIWIAGGDGKGADFRPLVDTAQRFVKQAFYIGKDKDKLNLLLAHTIPGQTVYDLDEAVKKASVAAQPGDTVLLSPACASLDMFDNFEHRGHSFAAAVEALQ